MFVCAATLAGVMTGHMLLETANDALFLENVSVERLPWVTIAVAFLALGLSQLDGGRSHRLVLLVLQGTAVTGTLVLWTLVQTGVPGIYYLLYLWSSIITSLIVVRFWLLLGDLYTIAEGKRVFASIAMGGSIGALFGSVVAAGLAPRLGGEGLLALASIGYGVSVVGPIWMGRDAPQPSTVDEESTSAVSWRECITALSTDPYAIRVSLIVMTAGMTLSVGDYLFKSVIAAEVDPAALATWLSRIYLGLNVLSIGLLAFGVTPLVRRVGIDRSLAILPGLFALGAAGVLAGATLIATIGIKLADGALRYSLHKTSTELLYLPMASATRRAVKTGIDLVGTTGAKALASLGILAILALPEPTPIVAGTLLGLAALWIVQAISLRQTYLDVFRRTLGDGTIVTMLDHPELDIASAGSLLRALSDPDPARSLAALQLLRERSQSDLVPSLILYHPAPRVVEAGLDLLTRAGRDDIRYMLPLLLEHEDAAVRAAAVRARWALDHDVDAMHAFDESQCMVVRLSAVAGLYSAGAVSADRFRAMLDEAAAYPDVDARHAATTTARLHYDEVHREPLLVLARDTDPSVALGAVRAIRMSGDAWFTPHLVDLLDHRLVRDLVRRALLDRGDEALEELAGRFGCDRTPNSVQAQIPRTIARFGTTRAADALLDGLEKVESGLVRFRILAALETLFEVRRGAGQPDAIDRETLDLTPLRREFDRTLERSRTMADAEHALDAAQAADPGRRTVGGRLLSDLLHDKRRLATGRLFRMLDLLEPGEDFRAIEAGLRSDDAADRAAAAEIVETVLRTDVAEVVLRVVPDAVQPVEERAPEDLAAAYADLLRRIMDTDSETLRAVALYHADELGIDTASDPIARPDADDEEEGMPERALSAVTASRERGLAALRELFDRERGPRAATTG